MQIIKFIKQLSLFTDFFVFIMYNNIMDQLEIIQNQLVEKIKSMPERSLLKELESKLLEDKECIRLIDLFKSAQDDYNFYLKTFGENHEYTIKSQKALYEAKMNLDNNPLVDEYNKCLIKCNEPLRYLEYNLISRFQRRSRSSC